eukprot:CAMPEP_0119108170 /NCGR_PEP_ID=MMETSP1180-20130426/13506_1 /TAXON_ID=3052 ORGANISM="Chlamydomonas cf sp, Strain CCMP681" /NCGR_SAMPLE_ID=MMETSP1180 /ASSEMBLY_ACC=CAM_ASM_000741 /LENGTH=516 /DNA_ID=CAMNT_0007093759 /DNA_START=29 /DNA_END=1576 /DNA_ORIENTATION=+
MQHASVLHAHAAGLGSHQQVPVVQRCAARVHRCSAPCPHVRELPAKRISQGRIGQMMLQAASQVDEVEEEPPTYDLKPKRGRPSTKDARMTVPDVIERAAPIHPYPGEFQQTLVRSFTLGGIGLHTGQYACVRVRPAFAGEGRYFVHVPQGTNLHRFKLNSGTQVGAQDAEQMPLEEDVEGKKIELFKRYLVDQEEGGFEGNFEQYLHALDAGEMITTLEEGGEIDEYTFDEDEPIQRRGEDEVYMAASLENIKTPQDMTLVLGEEGEEVIVGAELLLAALETAGVDNARIEIEGGREVPVLDGSALGWSMEVQFAGVRPTTVSDDSDELVVRMAPCLVDPLTVHDGRAFISYVPENTQRVSAGVDWKEQTDMIGRQWFSWCLYEDLPFRFELAPARRYLPTVESVTGLTNLGLLRGGAESVVMVASGDKWWDPTMIRFVRDEAARHEAALLIGSLSLLAKPGHAGLPLGHVVSYQATPALHIKFLEAMQAQLQPEDWVPVWADDEELVEEAEEGE